MGKKLLMCWCCWLLITASLAEDRQESPWVVISVEWALPIGIKIWFNECGGQVEGLTSWNQGENFASMGIGHFTWHPITSKAASLTNGFPALVNYIREQGAAVPMWLQGERLRCCPWKTREEFMQAKNSAEMVELRIFLRNTIPLQATYLAQNLQKVLPNLLAHTPVQDRSFIHKQFHTLASTPSGLYALIDYLNFKGAGVSTAPRNYEYGTGLLQVLKGMAAAPAGTTPLRAYVWSAKQALTRRGQRAAPHKKYEIWLNGWFKRLDTYLEGDLTDLQVV